MLAIVKRHILQPVPIIGLLPLELLQFLLFVLVEALVVTRMVVQVLGIKITLR